MRINLTFLGVLYVAALCGHFIATYLSTVIARIRYLPHNYMEENGFAATLAARRSAGVTPEVNLNLEPETQMLLLV